MANTRDFATVIRKMLADDPGLAEMVEGESLNINVAEEIYNARTEAGISQSELARRLNTQQSVIARWEDAGYDGHSLNTLRRIASALGQQVRVQFCKARYAAPATQFGSGGYSTNVDWQLYEVESTSEVKIEKVAANG